MTINDDSRSRHPSRLGPRTPVSEEDQVEDEELTQLVQQASKPKRSLADLYRTARERNLLREQPHYT